jgi:hypothetical protein
MTLTVTGFVGTTAVQASTKVPSGDPCTVVPLPEVKKAFPSAKPGARDTRIEKYGITECVWKDSNGVMLFGVQEFYGRSSAKEEAQNLGQAMVEGNVANALNVRYETLKGVGLGNEAVAIVEATDSKRGIVSAGAMLTIHRGERTLFLTTRTLPASERAETLKTLEALGKVAAKRLD